MSRQQREEIVATLSQRLTQSQGLIVLDYTGLNVKLITELRRQIKSVGSEFKVAKNTLLNIAAQGTAYEPLCDSFVGQTAVAFIDDDPAKLAKIITKFVQANPALPIAVRAGVLEKDVLSVEDLTRLGELPGREVLLGQFVGVLVAPLTGFVSVLADVPRKFLRVLSAIAEQKEASS